MQVSVRTLVEFILREGDIDNRRAHMAESAMQEGSRLHRKIQKSMGSDYHAEVPLEHTYVCEQGDLAITVDGRADGIMDGEPITIDEIKGTYRRLDKMEAPDNVHLARAKCYAYIYATDNEQDNMIVQMTYVNMETEDVRRFAFHYTYEELHLELYLVIFHNQRRCIASFTSAIVSEAIFWAFFAPLSSISLISSGLLTYS